VNDEDAFVAQLNQRLTSKEFLNLSIPGYSTDQQLMQIKATGKMFNPDVYISRLSWQ